MIALFLFSLILSQVVGQRDSGGGPIRFLLLTTQRSGSHFFRDTFIQQKGVYFWDELCFQVLYGVSLKSLGSCMERISFTLALPTYQFPFPTKPELQAFIENARHKHIYENSKKLNCDANDRSTARDCYFNFVNQEAQAVGAIVHQDQGWRNIQWMRDLTKLIQMNQNQYGIRFCVFLLHRTNFIAHSLALQNTIEVNPSLHSEIRQIDLKLVAKTYGSAGRVFYYTASFLAKQRISTAYVAYERLLSAKSSNTFDDLFRFANITMVSPIALNADTKHHTNHTYSYVENLLSVIRDLLASDENDIYQHVLVASNDTNDKIASTLKLCMLFDNCIVQPPAFCGEVACFV